MDPAAIAELTVDMFHLIDKAAVKHNLGELAPEIEAMMLDKAMSLYISNRIGQEKYGSKPKADAPKDDDHCPDCGRELSIGEKQFLEGKTGDARQCYHCSHK